METIGRSGGEDVDTGTVMVVAVVSGWYTLWRTVFSVERAVMVVDSSGAVAELVVGWSKACLMSAMPAKMRSSRVGVGMMMVSGNHSSVSVMRTACVSCIKHLKHR